MNRKLHKGKICVYFQSSKKRIHLQLIINNDTLNTQLVSMISVKSRFLRQTLINIHRFKYIRLFFYTNFKDFVRCISSKQKPKIEAFFLRD